MAKLKFEAEFQDKTSNVKAKLVKLTCRIVSTHKLSNIKLDDYRDFLRKAGCKKIATEGGHEKWARKDLLRPIIV